ncbi:ADP-ribosylation factor 2-like [Planoprotostelium fungivorum]|uniref:ADP-ribosylation factor 2-like n=1 Tax=Planoprotostelium fungivorum TaxID=1890364 RepID=A0A2P6MU80_9EUKA|nr:ADP-ribosylation factor 2-like [Planoprotostelium fungivorum]
MGQLVSMFIPQRKLCILVVGLVGAGKTTAVSILGELTTIMAAIQFEIETATYRLDNNVRMIMWDIGGEHTAWVWFSKRILEDVDGVVFVVDAADEAHLEEAKTELNRLLNVGQFKGAPVLVLANKMDLASASTAQVATRLGLDGWNDRHWHVEATSATHKTGRSDSRRQLHLSRESYEKEKQSSLDKPHCPSTHRFDSTLSAYKGDMLTEQITHLASFAFRSTMEEVW